MPKVIKLEDEAASAASSVVTATSTNTQENTMKEATSVTLTAAQVMAALEANGSTQGGQKFVSGRIYTRQPVTTEMLVGLNLPPQARVCVRAILEGAGTWTEEELHDHVQTYTTALATKQDAWKVFTYYRPRLIKAGFVSMNK